MTFQEFQHSVASKTPPSDLSNPLLALWYDAQDDWETAHDYAQRENESENAWVHAYLHRKEGDLSNANYWYTRASRTMPEQRIEDEWEFIVQELLKNEPQRKRVDD